MDVSAIASIAGMVASVLAAATAGLFSVRARSAEHGLAELRRREGYLRDVVRLAQEPLLYAASDLQSRLWNIVNGSFVEAYSGRGDRHGTNVVEYTAFLFAQYFGWAEAIRQGVFVRDVAGHIDDSEKSSTAAFIRGISDDLRTDKDGTTFMLFAGEQHAIGELMFSWDASAESRRPTVMRYATFAERFRTDERFRSWFAAIEEGMLQTKSPEAIQRLSRVQNSLVDLMELLDPDGRIYKQRLKLPEGVE